MSRLGKSEERVDWVVGSVGVKSKASDFDRVDRLLAGRSGVIGYNLNTRRADFVAVTAR